ncbi:MAG: IS200/IS605 family transposase [Saprospiraceae bacterium]
MAHSKAKNWIHLVFCTKNREHFITPKAEPKIHQYLRDELRNMKCPVDSLNGMSEHIHILFLLHPQKSLSQVVRQLKGGSSHAINYSNLLPCKFAWSLGYAAYSVSESGVSAVRRYIQNQKEHHRKRSFIREYQEFLSLHGFDDDKNG